MRHDDPEKRQNGGIIEIFFFLSKNEIKRTIVGCRGFSCHVVAYDVIGKLAWYCNTCFGGFFSPLKAPGTAVAKSSRAFI
jgi:hypothetical protein